MFQGVVSFSWYIQTEDWLKASLWRVPLIHSDESLSAIVSFLCRPRGDLVTFRSAVRLYRLFVFWFVCWFVMPVCNHSFSAAKWPSRQSADFLVEVCMPPICFAVYPLVVPFRGRIYVLIGFGITQYLAEQYGEVSTLWLSFWMTTCRYSQRLSLCSISFQCFVLHSFCLLFPLSVAAFFLRDLPGLQATLPSSLSILGSRCLL